MTPYQKSTRELIESGFYDEDTVVDETIRRVEAAIKKEYAMPQSVASFPSVRGAASNECASDFSSLYRHCGCDTDSLPPTALPLKRGRRRPSCLAWLPVVGIAEALFVCLCGFWPVVIADAFCLLIVACFLPRGMR